MLTKTDNFKSQFEGLTLDIKGVRLPEITIPDEDLKKYGCQKGISNKEFLIEVCRHGYKNLPIDKSRAKEYAERIGTEMALFEEASFIDYILLIWDVINFCRKEKIPVGKGRGSAAGSLVLYFSGVTGIDPIKNGLFFERFVSKARTKSQVIDGVVYIDGDLAPDVDLDICQDRRSEVVDYLAEKYKGRFCKLSTYQTLQSKILIKECGKIVAGYNEDDIKAIASHVPVLFGKVHSLDKAVEDSEKFKAFSKENPRVFKIAKKLQKLIKNRGSHASAYLISYDPLNTFMPCEYGVGDEILSSIDMSFAQKESIKLDLLGLDAVTLVQNLCDSLNIESNDIDVNDYDTIYKHLQDLECPYGLFQLSGDTNVSAINKIKPENLSQVSDVTALARPGALKYIDEYAAFREEDFVSSGNEAYDKIVSETRGIMIYQETLMQIANQVFQLPLSDGESIRRAVGKKKRDEMLKYEKIIKDQGEKLGLQDLASKYWDSLIASADYSFNKSHSISYVTLSALTIYFKFNHPLHFFLECLKMAHKKPSPHDEIAAIHKELYKFGIELLPPDLVKSKMDFTIEDGNIRYGLSFIKGISDKSIGGLDDFISTSAENEHDNKFEVFNSAKQAGLKVNILGAIIQAGALSSMGYDRTRLVLESQLWNILTERERVYCLEVGSDYDYDLLKMVADINEWKKPTGAPFAAKTRFDTIKKKYQPYKEIFLKNKEFPTLVNWFYEKKVLGYSYSTNLREVFSNEEGLQSCDEVNNKCYENDKVYAVVEVVEKIKGRSKASDKKYIKMKAADETGAFTCMMIGEKLEQYLDFNEEPKENSIILIEGNKGKDITWINKISIQDYKVYMKLGDLR